MTYVGLQFTSKIWIDEELWNREIGACTIIVIVFFFSSYQFPLYRESNTILNTFDHDADFPHRGHVSRRPNLHQCSCTQAFNSGFIAAHVLDELLKAGHSVVTSVRSDAKGQTILKNHPNVPKSKLDFVIVEDIAHPGAFDTAIKSDPPFETVIHTSSPFHFNTTDSKKDLLDPAIIGTTGILKAIKQSAPTVNRVVSLP